ncbi:hypothetical protein [Rathayibacter soli]|uniref:hypothetical protein n=1 Tax=Rathayibacter soli TaxID=3144168 RepID=UPI0027E4C258|nr:hypothetical protein [Glaciibacter superstes]
MTADTTTTVGEMAIRLADGLETDHGTTPTLRVEYPGRARAAPATGGPRITLEEAQPLAEILVTAFAANTP